MRAIDGDRLKRKAQKVATEAWKMKIKASVETTLNEFVDWIDDAPTIEPEQIVRCKDCKYFYKNYCIYSTRLAWSAKNDDFCSRAERREDG